MAQELIGIRFGKPNKTTLVAVCKSLVGDDVTITINGIGDFVVSMSQIGTDHTFPEAGFVGSKEITGLQPNTKYTYSVSQAGNTLDYDDNGMPWYTWTSGGINDDFIVMPATCDNNGSLGGNNDGYTAMRAIAEAHPNKAMFMVHIDDHYGYTDLSTVSEGTGGSGHEVSGFPSSAASTSLQYDYALACFSAFGLYDATGVGASDVLWGQHADRVWCMRNIPVLPQWGDHDCGANEMGWDVDPTDNTTAALTPSPLFRKTNSKVVWDAFLAPFQGDSIQNADTTANHWAHTLGCLKIIAPDGISNGSGDATTNTLDRATEFKPPTDIYGANQISDVIDACDDDSVPFKMMPINYGIRWTIPDPGIAAITHQEGRNGRGCQNPIAGNEGYAVPRAAHAEYAQLMTDAGGIMSKPSCNGRNGVFFTVNGDYHCGAIQVHKNTVGTNPEWFYNISIGTISGSTNFPSPGQEGVTVDGTTTIMESGTTRFANNWWLAPLFVYGSRPVREIEVRFYDKNNNVLFGEKFGEIRAGNDTHSLKTNLALFDVGAGLGDFQ